MRSRSFLLGNGTGMVLLAPVELNTSERATVPHKWFGVSEFGRKYLEVNQVWVKLGHEASGASHLLSRHNQVSFDLHLTEAVRTFVVSGVTVRERFFVPKGRESCLLVTFESDRPATFTIEPQFDMRYYQQFNEDFSRYGATADTTGDGHALAVWNEVNGPGDETLTFHSVIRCARGGGLVQLLPAERRFRKRTYLKDERREKLIHKAYSEIHDHSPDEAPIWESYQTTVYAPATITVDAPAVLAYGFDADEQKAREFADTLADLLLDSNSEQTETEREAVDFLDKALLQTGNGQVDLAYNQVVTRFNSALVVRKSDLLTEEKARASAIFAGDKYFLDPWKRDENISLEGLLACNDFETVRDILDDTWQHQDERTGRLPQILRLSEPLVYFSSDGTLWALRRLAEYTRMSGDLSLWHEKRPMIERFFRVSLESCRGGLLPSGGVIKEGFLWETWSDTAFTPREGYPAEIELLWLANLRDFLPWIRDGQEELAARMGECLVEGTRTFERLFRRVDELSGYQVIKGSNAEAGVDDDGRGSAAEGPSYIADSLDYDFEPRDLVTPNGFLADALDFKLPEAVGRGLVATARRELAGRVGVKSLAPRDWPKVFSAEFLADHAEIEGNQMASVGIYNYHRGIEWLWLNPFMVALELRHGDADGAYRHYVQGLVRSALEKSGVGGLDELEDLHGPLGADFQAWSMAGFIVALRRFAGVTVDALNDYIRVCPQLPSSWPGLRSRHRIGRDFFDVDVRRLPSGGRSISIRHDDKSRDRTLQRVAWRSPPGQEEPIVIIDGSVLDPRKVRRSGDEPRDLCWVDADYEDDLTVEIQPRR